MRDYCIYRYVSTKDGSVLYVGKTDASLKARIDAHAKESKFLPHLGSCRIEYFRLDNSVETDIVEKYLINKWKPVLNVKDNVRGLSLDGMNLPQWRPYSEYIESKSPSDMGRKLAIAKKTQDLYDCIMNCDGETFTTEAFFEMGDLPIWNGVANVIEKDVGFSPRGYFYKVSEGAKIVKAHPRTTEAKIWEGVFLDAKLDIPDSKRRSVLQGAADFANVLMDFQENGYEEDFGAERFILRLPGSTNLRDAVVKYYTPVISGRRRFEEWDALEVIYNPSELVPDILEAIYRDEVSFMKAAGIIPGWR